MPERTFALLKPEAVEDSEILVAIITRILRSGFDIVQLATMRPDRGLLEKHYQDHQGKDFFEELIKDLEQRQMIAFILEREDAISQWRAVMGPYQLELRQKPEYSNTIRGQFMHDSMPLRMNFCHGADSVEAAEREIALWFPNLAS